jgi:hypothetical protein
MVIPKRVKEATTNKKKNEMKATRGERARACWRVWITSVYFEAVLVVFCLVRLRAWERRMCVFVRLMKYGPVALKFLFWTLLWRFFISPCSSLPLSLFLALTALFVCRCWWKGERRDALCLQLWLHLPKHVFWVLNCLSLWPNPFYPWVEPLLSVSCKNTLFLFILLCARAMCKPERER